MNARPLKVLLIDDDEESYLLTRHLLSGIEQWAFQVDWVSTYKQGLESIRANAHDICLIDYRLNGDNGLDLLREAVASGCQAPMIMLTGLGDREVDLQAMRAGAADYLRKDRLDAETLERSIRYAMEHKRLQDEIRERAIRLRSLAGQLSRAEQRERSRIARLLHDHVQQTLVAAKMRVEHVQQQQPSEHLQHVHELVDEVLQASRTLSVELSPPILLDAGLVAGLNWLSRWMQDRHGLHVVTEIDPDAEPVSDSVRLMLFHAVRELLFNVIKHARVSEARLTMHAEEDQVHITISDAGIGFDPARLDEASAARSAFGLVSLRERIELIGGRLDIEAAPQHGCRIDLLAPRLALEEPTAPEPAPAVNARADLPGRVEGGRVIRILLVDDHTVVRDGLAHTLSAEQDLRVVGEAGGGREAIEMSHQLKPDVVIMDVAMPGVSGVEATRRIHREMPDVRVIGLSMYADEEMAQTMRRAGAVAYLGKGGPVEDLLEAIRNTPRHTEAPSPHSQSG